MKRRLLQNFLNITTFKYLRRRLKINIKIFLALFKEVKNEF